jgi:hypothetical protein
MDKEQREYLRKTLKPGICLVSDPIYPEPFLVNVPNLQLPQDVSDDEVLERLDSKVDYLYHPEDVPMIKDAIRRERGIPADAFGLLPEGKYHQELHPEIKSNKNKTTRNKKSKAPIHNFGENDSVQIKVADNSFINDDAPVKSSSLKDIKKTAMRLVMFWLNVTQRFIPQTELFKKAGVTSGSLQSRITHTALTLGLIIRHPLQKGKSILMFWEPTDKAWQLAGIPKPQQKGNGKYIHQYLAGIIAAEAKRKGYQVEIESFQQNNKAIDLVLRKGDEQIWVEIAVSEPLIKEINNSTRNFESGIVPSKFFIACLNSKMKNKMLELINNESEIEKYRDWIEVVLALDLPDLI